ncbi:MAG TPA: response regulator, partial [Anaerolineales bacterium]
MNQEVNPGPAQIPKVLIVCDQSDTAPVWGYILRQQGLIVILITSVEKAMDRWTTEIPDLVVIDITAAQGDPVELCRKFRELSGAPLLLILPTHHETQILEAYAAGVDEVAIKPISPAIFLAKIQAWIRHSWIVSAEGLNHVKADKHRLDLARRCLLIPAGKEIRLTSLEFRLLL